MSKTLSALTLLGGATVGAGLMFYLDPDRGARRRARLLRQTKRTGQRAVDLAGDAARDVKDRSRLLVREAVNGRHFKRVLAPRPAVRARLALADGRTGKVALATLAATVAAAGGAMAYRQSH
jgi:hypothetical protein